MDKIEIITQEELIKKYDIKPDYEYDMIPLTGWYIMDFGYVFLIDYYLNDSEPLNETYAVIVRELNEIMNVIQLALENGYYYENGEIKNNDK